METTTLSAERRTRKGKNESRRLRTEGMVPAIIYGTELEPQMIKMNAHDLEVLMLHTRGTSVLISLKVDNGQDMNVYIKDYQRDPLTGKLLHVDLLSVSLTETVDLEIPLHFVGTAKGIKEGGIVDYHLREVEIRSLPQEAPPYIDVDISDLGMNEAIHVADLNLAEKYELLTDEDISVVACNPPEPEKEEEEEEDLEALEAEPEIIGKGKKEDEEEGEGEGEREKEGEAKAKGKEKDKES